MNVNKIPISQAIPGMIIADDVYTKDNHLIIAKDTALTDKIITRLVFYSILDIVIYNLPHMSPREMIENKGSYYEKIKSSPSFQSFHMAYRNVINDVKSNLDGIATGQQEIDADTLLSDAYKILYRCHSSIELFDMLHCLRQYEDATYIHSLNVALICNIIGKWLHFSPEDLEVITLSGILHDIGKLMIPSTIITKPAKLTEEEYSTVKTHTLRGYNLLKSKPIDPRIKHAVLMHHERCDGSGYPYGFYNQQIDPFAKLVSIADVYDAMTSARVYRGPLCPFIVVSIFEAEGYSKYDPKYMLTFMEGIIQTYLHNNVLLNNDMVGEIVLINKLELSRPIVKVGEQYIELSKQRDLHITSLF